MRIYADGLTWGEGPCHHAGALWVSDTQGGGVWTDESGTWSRRTTGSQPNGLWFLPGGDLVGAILRENRVGRWDGADFTDYADLSGVAHGPLGDMTGDHDGGLYVDDVGYAAHLGEAPVPGRIVYVSPDRQVRVAAEGIEFPNGIALIDDGGTLIVAETWAQRLLAFTVGPEGRLTDRRLYADLGALLGPDARPDGLCPGRDGVWVCTLDGHAVVLVTPDRVARSIDLGDRCAVACATDGDSQLFVTAAERGGRAVMEAIADRTVRTDVRVFDV